MGEKYTIQEKLKTSLHASNSQDVTLSEIMETIPMTNDKQTDTAESAHKAADEDLLSLFDQYSDLMSSSWDWLSKDIDVINKTCSEGNRVEYSIIVQQCTTTTLFDTGPNVSIMS